VNTNSGKLLIATMLVAGVLAAGASWWFRYTATHRAAQFWGPEAATLIRDASHVDMLGLKQAEDAAVENALKMSGVAWQTASSHDVSQAPGLTHLRNALLEDRSFVWPAAEIPDQTEWTHGLRFHNGSAASLVILFSPDFGLAVAYFPEATTSQVVSCEPIAEGLKQVFTEWAGLQPRPTESPGASDSGASD